MVPGFVDDDHGLGHGVEDRAQVRLAGAQGRLRLLLLLDTQDNSAMAGRSAICVRAHTRPRERSQQT